MEQQLLESIIDITPATMEDLLNKIQTILASNSIEDEKILSSIVKSLFFGLWNFDKMINQHNLSTKISEMLVKLPKKNAFLFFKRLITYLQEKWNLIDHHRINKFMQLVRYLLLNSFKLCEKYKINKKKIDEILLEVIYSKNQQSGLAQHIADIYFSICEQIFQSGTSLKQLQMFQNLLINHSNQHLRLYIIEHIYGKYKSRLGQKFQGQSDILKLEESLLQLSDHFLEIARKQQKDSNRKNLYTLIGFAKSTTFQFSQYLAEKKEKAALEEQKRRQKMSKFKKLEIKALKAKRKEKKKGGKKTKKIQSVRNFQEKGKGRRGKKGIQQL